MLPFPSSTAAFPARGEVRGCEVPALTPLLPALTLPGARRCLRRWGRCRSPIHSQLPHFLPELQITVSHPPLPPGPTLGAPSGLCWTPTSLLVPEPPVSPTAPFTQWDAPHGQPILSSALHPSRCSGIPTGPLPPPPRRLSPLPHTLSASLSHFPDGVPAIINPSCAKGWGCLEVGP